jgi:hypothetical protein
MFGLTNDRPVVADRNGPGLINRIAAEGVAIDPTFDCPKDPREARAAVDKLQAQMVRVPKGDELRGQQYDELYNGRLRTLEKAKRYGLYPRNFMLPRPSGPVTPDVLRQFQDLTNEIDEKIEAYESKYADPKNKTPSERRLDAIEQRLNRALPAIVKHSNQLGTELEEVKAKLARLEAVMALGPRLVQPALTTGHPDLIERESP